MELGKDVEDGAIEEKIAAQRPEQCALLIYTVRVNLVYFTRSSHHLCLPYMRTVWDHWQP